MPFSIAAAAYDILSNPEKRVAGEIPFLRRIVGEGTRVLDLACGTGAHAHALAEAGCSVVAVDISPAMIGQAKERRSHPRVRFEVGDMRDPPDGPFDFVYCIGNSLDMLPDRDDVRKTFAAVRNVLADEGAFLIHCINPDSPAHAEPNVSVKTGMMEEEEIVVVKSMAPHGRARFISFGYFTRDLGDAYASRSGRPLGRHADWDVAATGAVLLDLRRDELGELLGDAGFDSLSWHGGLDGRPLEPEESPDLVVVAQVGS